jgi:hypothetical protein
MEAMNRAVTSSIWEADSDNASQFRKANRPLLRSETGQHRQMRPGLWLPSASIFFPPPLRNDFSDAVPNSKACAEDTQQYE